MAETKVTGVRIPPDILSQVDRLVGTEGGNRTEVILTLIRRGLGIEGSDTATVLDRIESLEKKLLSSINGSTA